MRKTNRVGSDGFGRQPGKQAKAARRSSGNKLFFIPMMVGRVQEVREQKGLRGCLLQK
jgi:hypothetical protein